MRERILSGPESSSPVAQDVPDWYVFKRELICVASLFYLILYLTFLVVSIWPHLSLSLSLPPATLKSAVPAKFFNHSPHWFCGSWRHLHRTERVFLFSTYIKYPWLLHFQPSWGREEIYLLVDSSTFEGFARLYYFLHGRRLRCSQILYEFCIRNGGEYIISAVCSR